ncbi:hypothetical protein L0668_07010 [Paraglaciecola aquimarina]|uniref:Uncharacterized protein n=1 Tax=Paraglaciecola algarum TaxID=3050085 RepID=A0ABS9D4J6_9ALTE|nr:hypothetical protein [Paraglaciecola sp. G1-23]MCF2947849.1 hypothetical protein [Paraglaciecola sp. G1-23]
MFDPLSKQKKQLNSHRQDYLILKAHKDFQLRYAKNQTNNLLSSPKGLLTSFILGACNGATPAKSVTGHTKAITLLERFLTL